MTFLAVALHEFGHLTVIYICGGRIKKFRISPSGLTIIRDETLLSYRCDIAIALAGPFINFLIALIFLRNESEAAHFFSAINIALGAMNLLPINNLDGGKILASLLCLKLPLHTAYDILQKVSFCFIFLLWIIAVYLLLTTKSNISLYIVCVWLFGMSFFKKK